MRLKTIIESIEKDGIIQILRDLKLKKAQKTSGSHTGRTLTSYSKGYIMDQLDEKNLQFYGLSKEEFDQLVITFTDAGYKVETGNDWRSTPNTDSVSWATVYLRKS